MTTLLVVTEDTNHADWKTRSVRPEDWPILRKGTIVELVGEVLNCYGRFLKVTRRGWDRTYDIDPRHLKVWTPPPFLCEPDADEIQEVTAVGGLYLSWAGAGFGQIAIRVRDGKVKIDSECMDRAFVKAVFSKLVDGAVFDGEAP